MAGLTQRRYRCSVSEVESRRGDGAKPTATDPFTNRCLTFSVLLSAGINDDVT